MATQVGSSAQSGGKLFSRNDFPPGFIFGASSSAFQQEGAIKSRGENIWDVFAHDHPEMIADGSNADVAIKFYDRYENDLRFAKDMNLDSYELSFSWARILRGGRYVSEASVNTDGVNYYTNLLQSLIQKGLEPVVTLFHFDVPQALEEDYMGLLDRRFVDDFAAYAEFCFKRFGHLVKKWITINEPYFVAYGGYGVGTMPPGRCSSLSVEERGFFAPIRNATAVSYLNNGDSGTEPYTVAHIMLLAHAAAVKKLRQLNQNAKISMALVVTWMEPYSEAARDQDAAKRALDFMLGWFLEPLTTGHYPAIMQKLVGNGLPVFTKEESESLKGSIDFLALHYYTARYAMDGFLLGGKSSIVTDPHVRLLTERNGIPIGKLDGSGWVYVYPKGIYQLLKYIKEKYNNPVIYITENGTGQQNTGKPDDLNDLDRIDYIKDHLQYVLAAMKEGVNVEGYNPWCLTDNFELTSGYTVRFGMIFVDYTTLGHLERTPKASYYWYKNFLKKLTPK